MKWFKHFSAASNSNNLTRVRMKYGADGYAIYWYCLELIVYDLGTTPVATFELRHDCEVIGYNLKIDTLRVEEIIRFMISIGLFESEGATGRVTCIKIAKHLEKKTTRDKTVHRIIDAAKEKQNLMNLSSTVADNPKQMRTVTELSGLDTDTDTDTEKNSTAVDSFYFKKNHYWHINLKLSSPDLNKIISTFKTQKIDPTASQQIIDEATGQALTGRVRSFTALVISLSKLFTKDKLSLSHHSESIREMRYRDKQSLSNNSNSPLGSSIQDLSKQFGL